MFPESRANRAGALPVSSAGSWGLIGSQPTGRCGLNLWLRPARHPSELLVGE